MSSFHNEINSASRLFNTFAVVHWSMSFINTLFRWLTARWMVWYHFSTLSTRGRVETKHRIARNLARIARKFTRSTKIEIEMLEKKFARFLLGSKEDRKFYARDRSDRNSMLEKIARKLKWKLDKEKLKIFALFVLWKWEKYVVFVLFFKIITKLFQVLEIF